MYACTNDSVTIHWQYVIDPGDNIVDVQWLYGGHSQEVIAPCSGALRL
jgi:hypothetical protein